MKTTIKYTLAFLCLITVFLPDFANSIEKKQVTAFWYEANKRVEVFVSENEFGVLKSKNFSRQLDEVNYEVLETQGAFIIIRPKGGYNIKNAYSKLRELSGMDDIYTVAYKGKTMDSKRRILITSKVIVRFKDDVPDATIKELEKKHSLTFLYRFPFSKSIYLYKVRDSLETIDVSKSLQNTGLVKYAYPDTINMIKQPRYDSSLPSDPLFDIQWNLLNTGQANAKSGEDINITSVWQTYRGSANEIIAIVDDGLDVNHEDLYENVQHDICYDFFDGDTNPTPPNFSDNHGTEVAGVAGARGFNDKGLVGVAPYAGLVGYRLLGIATDSNEAQALTLNNDKVDIYTNSWGPSDDGQTLQAPGPLLEDALEEGVKNGRGGLGSIYVWAGGNGGADSDNSNYDGYANSRFTIAVSASSALGTLPPYSEPGANILVNTSSSGFGFGVTTTNLTDRFSPGVSKYTHDFGGTSASAPMVAGTVALMLEANPALTWKDVQIILANTATKIDSLDTEWSTNKTGYLVHNYYGFGRVNVSAAVNSAITWKNMGSETLVEDDSSPEIAIPDGDSDGIADTITISDSIKIEFVEIIFNAKNHNCWGDLSVTLESPSGTESRLALPHTSNCRRTSYSYDNWRFGSVRHLGEDSKGEWKLKVADPVRLDTGTFESWSLKIYGTKFAETPPIPKIYTGGSTNSIVDINSGEELIVLVALDAGGFNGTSADWWLTASTPYGHYYFADKGDVFEWEIGSLVSYRGEIVDLLETEALILDTSNFQPGDYIFTFGVDDNPDGNLDLNRFYSKELTVNIL